ncbi:hypothetical protein K474DRAFT_804622 [Panus rudis PR-1116 ss-1]|nr:hypothetical protein K474DRAFT_804622 [Panus rudis PR-1116 ss-1]
MIARVMTLSVMRSISFAFQACRCNTTIYVDASSTCCLGRVPPRSRCQPNFIAVHDALPERSTNLGLSQVPILPIPDGLRLFIGRSYRRQKYTCSTSEEHRQRLRYGGVFSCISCVQHVQQHLQQIVPTSDVSAPSTILDSYHTPLA